MARQLKQSHPSLTCMIHHGRNETFTWWVVARFSYGPGEAQVLDVSVECRRRDSSLQVQADVATESGLVLDEVSLPSASGTETNGAEGTLSGETLERIEHFLKGQVEGMRQQLREA